MLRLPGQRALSVTALATALLITLAGCMRQRAVVLGFWFEPVTYSSSRFGRALTAEELDDRRCSAVGLTHAFAGFCVTVWGNTTPLPGSRR